ncbi:MAG: HAD-IA family hydrolase [Pseudomonadota bacterium]
MGITALFLGSIGVVAETSDIQRRAYNQAMAEANLDWHWDKARYRELLSAPGGQRRLRTLAAELGTSLSDADIERIHARKTILACEEVVSRPVRLRPGVAPLVQDALSRGIAVAFVTTTFRENIDAIAAAAGDELPLERFAAILTIADAEQPKPAPDVYQAALSKLGIEPAAALALEDSTASVAAAKAAGIYTVAVPGEYTRGQDFSAADQRVDTVAGFTVP